MVSATPPSSIFEYAVKVDPRPGWWSAGPCSGRTSVRAFRPNQSTMLSLAADLSGFGGPLRPGKRFGPYGVTTR